jgi:hypothetical protein
MVEALGEQDLVIRNANKDGVPMPVFEIREAYSVDFGVLFQGFGYLVEAVE